MECEQIRIKRGVYGHMREEDLECSQHGYADAGKKGYCAVTYFSTPLKRESILEC